MFLHSMSIICNYRMPQDTEHEMDDIEVVFAPTKKNMVLLPSSPNQELQKQDLQAKVRSADTVAL